MAVTARCFPSGLHGEPIAGDFFDVLALSEARTLITVGDVVGHGLAAAARMTALRSENRALVRSGRSLAEVLDELDGVQCRQGPEDLATLWLGIYDVTMDSLEYASAGHPPAVLANVGGSTRLLSPTSAPPLGSGQVGRHVVVERVPFTAGALLVAYSDGLIERAGLDLEHQIEVLRRIVQQLYQPALSQVALERWVGQVLRRLPVSPIGAPDDVCILAVHRPLVPAEGVTQLRSVSSDGVASGTAGLLRT